MIVVLRKDANKAKQDQLIEWLKGMGLGIHVSVGEYQTILGLIGDTTSVDIETAKKLEEYSGIKAEDISKGLIEHSESLLNKRYIEIVYNDFKEFNIEGNKVGLTQAVCKSKEEYDALKSPLGKYLEDSCKTG